MRLLYRGAVHLATEPAPRLVRIVCSATVLPLFSSRWDVEVELSSYQLGFGG